MDSISPDSWRFGTFELDLRAGELRKGGVRVRLQQQPFRLLAVLLTRAGQLVTRDELRHELWSDDTNVDFDHCLNNAVNRLREALGDDAETPRFVERLARRGYRFVAPVEAIPPPADPSDDSAGEAVHPGTPPAAGRLPGSRRFGGRTAAWSAIALLALAAVAASLPRARPPQSPPIRSIAVLPLENLTGDPTNDYFSEGLTESLITALSRVGDLRVISRGSVFRLKERRLDPRAAGRELGVEAVLEGSVRKGADSVRVVVRLVSVEDGRVLWSRTAHEQSPGDVFAVQDEVALSTAAALRWELGREGERRVAKRYTGNVEAYEAYLKGRYFWNKRTAEGLNKAVEHFERALRLDPQYALAQVGLADSYVVMEGLGLLPSAEANARVKAAATRALEIDQTLAEAHVSLAWLDWWDWPRAERDFKRALELNPNHATARQWHAEYLTALGRFDEAVAEIRRAQELDPAAPIVHAIAAQTFLHARRYDRAVEECRRALELDPDFALGHSYLAMAYAEMGRHEEAAASADRAARLEPTPAASFLKATLYALSGQRAKSEGLLGALIAEGDRDKASSYRLARIYASLGKPEVAFECLEKALARREQGLVWLKVDARLDTLRSDPRFADLLRRAGLAS